MSFIETVPKYGSLYDVENIDSFRKEGQPLLKRFLIDLFNLTDVHFQYCSKEDLLKHLGVSKFDIVMPSAHSPREVCLVSQVVIDDELIFNFPYILVGRDVKKYANAKSIYSRVAKAIAAQLKICYLQKFQSSAWLFGGKFAELMVANCISSKKYNGEAFSKLIETMEQLSVSTFEGENFTTGVIVTRDTGKYKGNTFSFPQPRKLDRLSKRDFFLVNGDSTFYVATPDLSVYKIYVAEEQKTSSFWGDYFENYYMHNNLQTSDFIVRTVGHNEVSVSDSYGKEFVKIENVWHYRYRANLLSYLTEKLGIDEELSKAILYYILYCSRCRVSSIMWIPNNKRSIKKLTNKNRVNLWNEKLNILDPSHQPLIKKVLASDGAVVIDKNGDIIYECVIAKMDPASAVADKTNTLKGTGESAAKLLAGDGVAIKISQDGAIKIYSGRDIIHY